MNTNPDRGGFVKLKLIDRNGAPALNATVRFLLGTHQIRREVRTSGGYCSSHDPTLNVGLGNEPRISNVEVTWSNGTKQRVDDILEGETLIIHQKK